MSSPNSEPNNRPAFHASWRWWLPPAAGALLLIVLFADPFIGDWDALEYTVSALRGYPSSMALGRNLFIFYNHALYAGAHAIFGLPVTQAYLLFKYVVVAQGPLVVVAVWILTRDLSQSPYAATTAALLMTFSPVLIVYSGQVMTEVPALLLLTIALIIHLRGVRQRRVWLVLIGAALMGAGVNLRETVGFYFPWLLVAPFFFGWKDRRGALIGIASGGVFLILAVTPFLFWFLTDPEYRAAWYGWKESMRVESALHPVSIRIVGPWLLFFLAVSPLVLLTLPMALVSEWRGRKASPILLLALVGLFANLLLLMNYSTAIGWRYLSTGLPALIPLSASYLDRSLTKRLDSPRRAFAVSAGAILLIGLCVGVFMWRFRSASATVRAAAKEYDRVLLRLPRDGVLIAGAQTVAVKYWRGIGAGEWDTIGVGAGWPQGQLATTIAGRLQAGRRIFLDADPRWWQPCGWHVSEIEELAAIETQFRFQRITPTVFEIKPANSSATDQPHLQGLLPQNRPTDVKACF